MLEEHGDLKLYTAGEAIFSEGSEGEYMYVLQTGSVEIFRDIDGNHVSLAVLKPYEFFGEMAFFGEGTRSASAKALEESKILVIDKATFSSFIKEPVVWQVIDKMSQRIRTADDKLSSYWSVKA